MFTTLPIHDIKFQQVQLTNGQFWNLAGEHFIVRFRKCVPVNVKMFKTF